MIYDEFDTGIIGRLTLVADEQGLRHIEFESARHPILIDETWRRDASFFEDIKRQLRAYFNGHIRCFDLPLAPSGTPFQQRVWRALQTIPYGTTVSYRWVAEKIGNPNAVRAVGGANARNPIPIIVPCHRVIGSNGTLTGFGGGLMVKQCLLDLEKANLRSKCGCAMVPDSYIDQASCAAHG